MMDQAEVQAMRRLWVSVLAEFGADTIRKLHAARRGIRVVRISNERIAIGSFDHEVHALRRYMKGRDFQAVCDMAGVQFDVEQAIASMIALSDRFTEKDFSRDWMRQVRLAA